MAVGCLVLGAGPTVLAQGQTAVPAGPRLTFDTNFGIAASDNPNFVVSPPDSGVWSTASLGFGVTDDTPLSAFSLRGNLTARTGIAGDTVDSARIGSRGLVLKYDRQGADAQFGLSAAFTESRIEFLRPLTDFIDDNGVLIPPTDINDLTGTGWRQRVSADASLTLFSNSPFGVSLAAGASNIHYRDVSSPRLDDSRRRYADIGLRFDLSQVVQASFGVRYSTFEDSNQHDDNVDLRAGLSFTRPDGVLRFGLSSTQTAGGTGISAQVGRSFQFAWGNLDGNFGVTRTAAANYTFSGSLNLTYDLAQTRLVASLSRSLVSGDNDAETLRTAAALGVSGAFSPNASWNVKLAYLSSEDLSANLTTQDVSLGLGYSYALTPDWNLNLGYQFHQRDKDAVGTFDENSVTLSLGRSFTIGF